MSDYEYKLAVRKAKADVKKAIQKWHKLGNISIDDILKDMGYYNTALYLFERTDWYGTHSYTIRLSTYDLLIKNTDKISAGVQ